VPETEHSESGLSTGHRVEYAGTDGGVERGRLGTVVGFEPAGGERLPWRAVVRWDLDGSLV
jgi:hypothetical protein